MWVWIIFFSHRRWMKTLINKEFKINKQWEVSSRTILSSHIEHAHNNMQRPESPAITPTQWHENKYRVRKLQQGNIPIVLFQITKSLKYERLLL